jgi:hypothetical protein
MTCSRSLRSAAAAALLSLAVAPLGCFPHAASVAQKAAPSPATPAPTPKPVTLSTAPVHVGPIRLTRQPSAGVPHPTVPPELAIRTPTPVPSPAPRVTRKPEHGPSATASGLHNLAPGRPRVTPSSGPPLELPSPYAMPSGGQAQPSRGRGTLPYVYGAPHAPPKILSISISSLSFKPGDTVSGSVETTSNVASVEIRIEGWGMSLPRPRIGFFAGSGVIPQLPFFAKGKYTLQVIARNADGARAERDIPITLR